MLNLKSLSIDADRVSMPIEDLPEFINLLEINSRIKQIESKILEIASAPPSASRKTLGITEAAKMLGLSKSRVYVLSGKGQLPSYKVGNKVLFFTDELENYIRSGGKVRAKTHSLEDIKR